MREYLSDKEVANRIGISRVTVWRMSKDDATFPKPFKFSPGCTRWRVSDLVTWEASRQVSA